MKSVSSKLLVAGSLLFSLALAEIICRFIETPEQHFQAVGVPLGFFNYEPALGWVNKPNLKTTLARGEFSTHIRHNSQGMRYHEVGDKQGFRVAVLGDSFVWGHGVEEQDRFTDLAGKTTEAEVLNFGVEGYGPLHYYMLLDKVLSFSPDLIVINYFVSNDLSDSVLNNVRGHYNPYAALKDGKMVIKGVPVPDTTRYLPYTYPLTQFALGRLIYAQLPLEMRRARPPHPGKEGVANFDRKLIYSSFASKRVEKVMAINEAILKAISQKVAEHHVPLVFLAVTLAKDIAHPEPMSAIKQMIGRLPRPVIQIPYADEYVYPVDGHWNNVGHKYVAEILAKVIEEYRNPSRKTQPAAL